MFVLKKDPFKWFKIWQEIIYREKEITRLQLAEKSDCSLWTIRSLQRDFLEWDAYILYKNNKFRLLEISSKTLDFTLSTLSEVDKEQLK